MGEFLLDLCVGTAVMLVQEGDDVNPIQFTPVPQYLIALEEGPYGTVDNVYRKYKLRVEAIKRQFPDAEIPESLIKLMEKADLVAIPDVGYQLEESITKEEKLSGVEVLVDLPATEKN